MTTYYDLLNIDDEATRAEVRKAYLKLAATCHPDKSLDDPDATAKFQLINEAYTTLYDDEARRRYDKKLNEPETIAQPRPCHVPVYRPPPAPPMSAMSVGVAPTPHFHLYTPAPPHTYVQHFMYPAYEFVPNRQTIHRSHFFAATQPMSHQLHWRPSPPMPRPPPPMMRLVTPPTRTIPPEYVRFQMLIAAEDRRRSFELGFN